MSTDAHTPVDDLAARAFAKLLTQPGTHHIVCGNRERAQIVFDETKRMLEVAKTPDVLTYSGFREFRRGDSTVKIYSSLER